MRVEAAVVDGLAAVVGIVVVAAVVGIVVVAAVSEVKTEAVLAVLREGDRPRPWCRRLKRCSAHTSHSEMDTWG